MRTVLFSTAALTVGFILSAVAQNPAQQSGGCGPNAMSAQDAQGMTQGGFTDAQAVPQAAVFHAVGPDGVPVIVMVAPVR